MIIRFLSNFLFISSLVVASTNQSRIYAQKLLYHTAVTNVKPNQTVTEIIDNTIFDLEGKGVFVTYHNIEEESTLQAEVSIHHGNGSGEQGTFPSCKCTKFLNRITSQWNSPKFVSNTIGVKIDTPWLNHKYIKRISTSSNHSYWALLEHEGEWVINIYKRSDKKIIRRINLDRINLSIDQASVMPWIISNDGKNMIIFDKYYSYFIGENSNDFWVLSTEDNKVFSTEKSNRLYKSEPFLWINSAFSPDCTKAVITYIGNDRKSYLIVVDIKERRIIKKVYLFNINRKYGSSSLYQSPLNFSNDGNFIVISNGYNKIKILETKNYSLAREIKHGRWQFSRDVKFDPTGNYVAWSLYSENGYKECNIDCPGESSDWGTSSTIAFYNINDGRRVGNELNTRIEGCYQNCSIDPNFITFSNDGNYLFTLDSKIYYNIWDLSQLIIQ
jgi:hypothetical protein